jgi:hypothetical protein
MPSGGISYPIRRGYVKELLAETQLALS